MTEQELITGLSDIETQLAAGNANQVTLAERLGEILAEMRKPQPAPQVSVPVTVQPAPAHDWKHVHVYDDRGRIVETISTRITKG